MEMVAAIVRWQKVRWVFRITRSRSEINNSVELSATPDPFVYFCPDFLGIWVVVKRPPEWRDGRSINANAKRMGARDDLFIRADDFIRGSWLFMASFRPRAGTDVVHALKNDQPAGTGLGQHITIHALQCVWPQPVMQ